MFSRKDCNKAWSGGGDEKEKERSGSPLITQSFFLYILLSVARHETTKIYGMNTERREKGAFFMINEMYGNRIISHHIILMCGVELGAISTSQENVESVITRK